MTYSEADELAITYYMEAFGGDIEKQKEIAIALKLPVDFVFPKLQETVLQKLDTRFKSLYGRENLCEDTKDPDGWDDCVEWEYFLDTSYYDLWAVRPVGENRWSYCFHMNSMEEAKGLKNLLNNRKFSILKEEKCT